MFPKYALYGILDTTAALAIAIMFDSTLLAVGLALIASFIIGSVLFGHFKSFLILYSYDP